MDERTWCPEITDGKDLEVTATGGTEKDYTVASRCRVRLLARRGRWLYDQDLGSRFWTRKTLRDVRAHTQADAAEALEPLVAEGVVSSVLVGQIETDPLTGVVGVEVFITLPHAEEGEALSVGTYAMGI